MNLELCCGAARRTIAPACGGPTTSGQDLRRRLAAAVTAVLLTGLAAAQEAEGPSFDCAKAATRAEKAVCDLPDLAWHDRQLSKAYAIARDALGEAGRPMLKQEQSAFLKAREACMAQGEDDECLLTTYAARVERLAAMTGRDDFAAGTFAAENGTVWAVRYPDDSVALSMSTVGANTHTCTFETERATVQANGAYLFSEKPDEMYEQACTLTATPTGDSLVVTAEGDGCLYYCGMRATLDGTFTRVRR